MITLLNNLQLLPVEVVLTNISHYISDKKKKRKKKNRMANTSPGPLLSGIPVMINITVSGSFV